MSAAEFHAALPDRRGDPPSPTSIDGWTRMWTAADSLEIPAGNPARIFVDKERKRRFDGLWASYGVFPNPRASMSATLGEVTPEEFVLLAGREVSYASRIVDNNKVRDPATGRTLPPDCAAIAFVPLGRYHAMFRLGMIQRDEGRQPFREIAARRGYIEKARAVVEHIRPKGNWNPLQELDNLLNTEEQRRLGSKTPPVIDADIVRVDNDQPDVFRQVVAGLTGNTPEANDACLALLTPEGVEASHAQGNSLRDYLLPIARQLPLHGVDAEAMTPVTSALAMGCALA